MMKEEYYILAEKFVQEICKPINRKNQILENIIKELKNQKKIKENE